MITPNIFIGIQKKVAYIFGIDLEMVLIKSLKCMIKLHNVLVSPGNIFLDGGQVEPIPSGSLYEVRVKW